MGQNQKYYLPVEDVNDEKATILNLYFKSGDHVSENDLIYTFETTKAAVDVEATEDGFIHYFVEAGDDLATGMLVCEISDQKSPTVPIVPENETLPSGLKLTQKAQRLADEHELDVTGLGLTGVIREKDLYQFINSNELRSDGKQCLFLDRQDELTKLLLADQSIRDLSSEQKIEMYRQHGHQIGKDVSIGGGSILIGNQIIIEDHVSIGENTLIEAPVTHIGKYSSIGNQCDLVASKLLIGEHNRILNKVIIDISGGRYDDSNFISGKGCLLAGETYVNVCREVKLGNYVALSPKSMIYTHSFWQSVLDGYPSNFGPVELKDDAWLGAVAQILPNCIIGLGSIIVSNSLVSQNVKDYSMVGGVPAIMLKTNLKKKYSEKDRREMIQKLFSELGAWLHMQQISVTQENNNFMHLSFKSREHSCFLFTGVEEFPQDASNYDIVISLDADPKLSGTFKTTFNIKNQSVKGVMGTIERLIIDFFRRKGIRFYQN